MKIANSRTAPLLVLVIVTVIAIALQAWYWQQLPARVATHFGLDGKPDGWMSRTSSVMFSIGVQIGLPLILLSAAQAAKVLPSAMVNIPNREYWLSREHRSNTLEYVDWFIRWIAVASAVFLLTLGHLVFRANQIGQGLNTPIFFAILCSYLTIVFTFVGFFYTRFRLPKLPN